MTLIALAGPREPRTAPEIATELELPAAGISRALRDLAAARLLTVELEPARIGYAATRPPSAITIAEIIEAAHPPRQNNGFGSPVARDRGDPRAPAPANGADGHPGARARQGLMAVLARITLSDVLNAQVRQVGY
jgi:DNA-binding IscR family transcriptional regulator